VAPLHYFLLAQKWVYLRVGFRGLGWARRRGIASTVYGGTWYLTFVFVTRFRDYLYAVVRLRRVLGAFGLPFPLLLRLAILARRLLILL
jgi:hypothetical protein